MFLAIAKHMLPFTRYPFTGREVPCPVCESVENVKVAGFDRRWKQLRTVACTHCGLLYTNPMPDEAELSHYYEKYYRFDYQLASSKPTRKHRANSVMLANQRAANIDGMIKPGARTLDFGCGSGEFVETLLEKGFDAHGFEPGGTYGSDARARLGDRILSGRWQDQTFGAEFDLVSCFHVVEHLRDPMPAIAAMLSWLKPGGRIYIEVPDLGSRPYRGTGGYHFAHVLGFNTFNLKLAAARLGLVPVREFEKTGILFERGDPGDLEVLAGKGRELTNAIFVGKSPQLQYILHTLRLTPRK